MKTGTFEKQKSLGRLSSTQAALLKEMLQHGALARMHESKPKFTTLIAIKLVLSYE